MDLIINRRARKLARQPRLVSDLAESARGRANVYVTQTAGELGEAAAEIAARGTDLVLLAGGDGTLMAGVTALNRAFSGALPAISPIPAGTAATISRNWDIVGSPVGCVERMFSRSRRLALRPSLRIREHGPSGTEERIGFIVGTGLVARFFRHYYARGAPGYSGSARLVARIFAESFVSGPLAADVLTPLPCRLIVDGSLCGPEAWSLICCSVIRNLGIHMLVNYRAAEDPSRPHLVATPMAPHQLGPRAPWVLAGRPIGGPDHVDRLAEHFTIAFVDGPGPYVLDGELLSASSVEVSAGPVLTVATPM